MENDMRGRFLESSRDKNFLRTLSPEEKVEVFENILLSSSDVYANLLILIVFDYLRLRTIAKIKRLWKK